MVRIFAHYLNRLSNCLDNRNLTFRAHLIDADKDIPFARGHISGGQLD